MSAADRAPLIIAPTHTRGLLEFSRACTHAAPEYCFTCPEFASRAELLAALRAAQTRDVRIGQTWLDESDLVTMLAQLDRYDAGRVA